MNIQIREAGLKSSSIGSRNKTQSSAQSSRSSAYLSSNWNNIQPTPWSIREVGNRVNREQQVARWEAQQVPKAMNERHELEPMKNGGDHKQSYHCEQVPGGGGQHQLLMRGDAGWFECRFRSIASSMHGLVPRLHFQEFSIRHQLPNIDNSLKTKQSIRKEWKRGWAQKYFWLAPRNNGGPTLELIVACDLKKRLQLVSFDWCQILVMALLREETRFFLFKLTEWVFYTTQSFQ